MRCQNHTSAVDFFALGVIGYEFMLGRVTYFLYYIFYIETICRKKQKGNKRTNDVKTSMY